MNMKCMFLLLLCYIPLQQFDSTLARRTEDMATGRSHSRKGRNLIFLHGSEILFNFGFGLPISVQDQNLTMGILLRFVYALPSNSTVFTGPYPTIQKRSTNDSARWDTYARLEAAVDRMELDGRACVLRAICEAADTTLRYNGLAGELLHVLLTPSTTTETHRSYLDREYHAAERLGTEISGSCHLLYSECKIGFLDLISKLEF